MFNVLIMKRITPYFLIILLEDFLSKLLKIPKVIINILCYECHLIPKKDTLTKTELKI